MSNTLHMLKNYPADSNAGLLNAGLSQSSQNLNEEDSEFEAMDIPRSGSLPNIPSSGTAEGMSSWTDKKEKKGEPDQDFSLNELVIYDPIEEENEEEEEVKNDEDETDPLNLSSSSRSSIKRSRKRDSAVLFDISLGDLEDFDLAGFLTEKHSEKDWYCVLMDQHLCLFPSQDPTEVAYDVVILPYCQISLDDRLIRTPVFRLTQPGMTPWVLVAKNNEELKEWINALTTAASGGKYSITSAQASKSERRAGRVAAQGMQAITEEESEREENEENLSNLNSKVTLCKAIGEEEEDEEEVQKPEKLVEEHTLHVLEKLPASEDIYEAIEKDDDLEDDGFATDEFESGSSENEDGTSPKGSPKMQQKTKKKSQLFKWLKKKTRTKDRLFSSPQDGVALAGYVHRIESNTCLKRWCVVREGKVYCYKNIKDEETEVTLELNGAEIRAREEEKNRFIIRVMKDNERLLTLLTKNTRDMDKWKTALRIESGFIKLASAADTSSGFFEEDDGDYVTPVTPIGLQKICATKSDSDTVNNPVTNGNHVEKDDVYLEVTFNQVNGAQKPDEPEYLGPLPAIPSGRKSPTPESLGPLPPLPTDAQPPALPPPRRSPIPQNEVEEKGNDADSEEFEDIYEEVTNPLPNADKLTNWHKKLHDETEQLDEASDVVLENSAPSQIVTGERLTKPPLTRKVSFDDKVEVINKHLPKSMQPEAEAELVNESTKKPAENPQETGEEKETVTMKKPAEKEIRSLPRRTLKESWIREKSVSDEKPRNKIISDGTNIEQDKEREIIQKTEEEFLLIAKALKEEGSEAVRQKRPSFVALNRIAFENRKRAENNKKILIRNQGLKKEKSVLLARIEFQKRRVAVAKDRKIFFSLSSTSNTAVADADMEFHESQLGLAKAKRRIAEIDNELKNNQLFDLKPRNEHVDGLTKQPIKTKESNLIDDDEQPIEPITDENEDLQASYSRNLTQGNVLSKLKVFENMGGKK